MLLRAGERVIRARISLVLSAPFFGVLASRLAIVEDPTCDTMWTDSVSVGYNPAFVDAISDHELKGTWVHEVFHVANGHCWRMGMRNPEDWNEACDLAINPIIDDAGYILPEGVLRKPAYKGMPAELIYEKIKKPHPSGQPQPPKGNPQDGKAESSKDGSGKEGSPATKGSKGKGKGKSDGVGQAPGQSGESTSPEQQQPKAPPRAGEVRPVPKGVDPQKLEQEWKLAVSNAATFAASQGSLPGYLKDFIDEVQKPTVDWREALWQFVQQSFYSPDYRWARPNRNYLPVGIYLPSLVGEEMPEIIISEDTSVSVYKALTLQFRSEMSAIMEQMRPRAIYHLQADTRITKVREMQPGDDFDNEVVGRGGTDFRPTFSWVEKEGISPACLLYMSDLDGPFPEKEPDYPVIWVCPPGSPNPPWGLRLEMSFDEYN